MKKIALFTILLTLFYSIRSYSTEETLRFGRFGTIHLYQPAARPAHVVLFVSGDGGWRLGVVDMVRELSGLNTLVIGVDIVHYLKELASSKDKCSYPAADFEALSKYVQKSLDFPNYILPVMIGYSSGATLVYATLVQSPPNTFAGALSLGFCPDFLLNKPMCKGYGLQWNPGPKGNGYSFLPAAELQAPWIVLQGTIDTVCSSTTTEEYVKQTGRGELILLPRVGHGYSVPRNWMPQFRQAFTRLILKREPIHKEERTADAVEVKDLPLIEVPAKGDENLMAVIVTGDGGWASIDRDIGNALAESGVAVVGFNSLQYFWSRRTPEAASKDLERVLRHYLTAWKKENAILLGYSFGADVLPFLSDRLTPDLLNKVKLIALLGPGQHADFEFHLTDWLGGTSHKTERPILPEVEKLRGTHILCFYGEDEEDSLCQGPNDKLFDVIPLGGGHHFGGGYQAIAEKILQAARE